MEDVLETKIKKKWSDISCFDTKTQILFLFLLVGLFVISALYSTFVGCEKKKTLS